jgi:hypothetical protein
MAIPKDLAGKKFGKLIAVEPIRVKGRYLWLCKCECGNTTNAPAHQLEWGGRLSCGCVRKQKQSHRKFNPIRSDFIYTKDID